MAQHEYEHLKGYDLKVGDSVTIRIWNKTSDDSTEIIGVVTGIRLWQEDRLAVEIQNISDWIVLNDKTEIGKY